MSENVKPESLGERVAREFFGPPATGNSSKEASETCYRDLNAAKLAALVDRLAAPAAPGIREAAVLSRLSDWTHEYGKALCPGYCTPDTFGEGMRAAKKQVADILGASGKAGWTKERPTRPGWYWVRAADFGAVRLVVNEIVRLHEEFGPMYVVGFGWGRYIENMPDAEWAGPIREPEVQHG